MATDQTCYFPDGSVAHRDTPCHSASTGASACCAYMDVCLDNQLCLSQNRTQLLSRGSCTDKTWGSPECSQYCSDASEGSGNILFGTVVDNRVRYCCGQVNTYNHTCISSTKGDYTPFHLPAGLVIYNRTSGSTSPNNTETLSATTTVSATATVSATTTVSATITVTASNSSSTHTAPSSRKDIGISAGMSGFLGLALLIAVALLWRQGKHKRNLSKDVQTWQKKYTELKTIVDNNARQQQHQASHQLYGWGPGELDGPRHSSRQLWKGEPAEVEGGEIYEMADKARRA